MKRMLVCTGGVAVAALVAASIQGQITGSDAPRDVASNSKTLTRDLLTVAGARERLDVLYERMITEGLALERVDVLSSVDANGTTLADVRVRESLWTPQGASKQPPGLYQAWTRGLSPGEKERLTGAPVGAFMVLGRNLEILGFAPVAAGDELDTSFDGTGLTFLAAAATQLSREGTLSIPSASPCGQPERVVVGNTPSTALVNYLQGLNGRSLGTRSAERAKLRNQAEQIANSQGTTVDSVTGTQNHADENDILEQLVRGVSPSSVKVRRTVPLQIEFARNDPSMALVFFEKATGRFLGWIPQTESASSEPLEVSLGAPDKGQTVVIFVRPVDTEFYCSPDGDPPVLTIGYDAIAGARRAHIQFDQRRVTPFPG